MNPPEECPKCGGSEFNAVAGSVEIAGQKYSPPPFWSCCDCIWCSMSVDEIKKYPEEAKQSRQDFPVNPVTSEQSCEKT